MAERSRRYTDEELLDKLKRLLARHGTLSADLIDNDESPPSSSTFQGRFGSLLAAYARMGYVPDRDYGYVDINRHLRSLRLPFEEDVVKQLEGMGASVAPDGDLKRLLINGEFTASIVFSRCRLTSAGTLRWLIDLGDHAVADITVLVRMDVANQTPTDFYLLPRIDVARQAFHLGEWNGAALDTYRFDTLHFFTALAARVKVEVAA